MRPSDVFSPPPGSKVGPAMPSDEEFFEASRLGISVLEVRKRREAEASCPCRRCLDERSSLEQTELPLSMTQMILCPKCGNKRCPHANDHRNTCTGSNDPGQVGSAYEPAVAKPRKAKKPPDTRPIQLGCEFTISPPPSVNHLFTNVPGVGRVKSQEYRDWIEAAMMEMQTGPVGPVRLPCRITVIIFGGKGFNKQRDIDNVLKPVIDLCKTAGVIDNDRVTEVSEVVAKYQPLRGNYAASCMVIVESLEAS